MANQQHTTANGITKLLMIINLKIIVFEKEREKKKSTKKGEKALDHSARPKIKLF